MQYSLALLALGASAVVAQQAPGYPLAGCQGSFSGTFSFQTTNLTSAGKMARSLDDVLGRPVRRQQASCGSSVTLTLNNGVLLDAKGRTGYIAAKNDQFQFDGPPQNPHSYTSGFSVCGNGSLALGGTAVFYNCLSGTFYNTYSASQGAQCFPVLIDTFPCAATGSIQTVPTSLVSAAGESTDNQVATTSSSVGMVVMTAQTSAPSTAAPVSSAHSAPSVSSVAATPYPIAGKNSSTPVATGTSPVVTTPVTSPIAGSSSPAPSSFKGAASVLAVGQGFVAMVAAAGAFFML